LQQGRRDLLKTLAAVAADYHALAELRDLRATAALQHQAVDLLRRIQQPHDLQGTAFAVANETRRLLACDRAAVLMKRGDRWRLLCVSGASRFDRKSEFARLAERLAENVANWGEPIVHEGAASAVDDLPPLLATALGEHLDHSHARQLAAVPVTLSAAGDADDSRHDDLRAAKRNSFDAVLLAEQFDGAAADGWQRQLIEIAELAAPALVRAATLERFPVRTAVRWAERWEALRQPLHRRRAAWIAGGIIAAVAALTFIPATLTVEAPATLRAAVEREIFASATGSVAEVRVAHGDEVKQGDVLIVLSDPELSLKLQQVRGEIEATRERLAALAVTRTDRTLRERETEDRLPLSAEQRQLEERLATLAAQSKLLSERHEALTLRSPIAGEVLTPDVQSLLASRPVERGQSLLTIADVTSGWELVADTPQRDVGDVVAAQTHAAAADPPTAVSANFRLSGDVTAVYDAHVLAISAAAPLEAEGLEDVAPPVKVRLAVDGEPPAAARPGMAASVRIDCGRRSLGYVWLHDAAATLYRWLTF
jgi:multidrug efflux pump subunit AcrA (membrane-fusion protein)